ncbi:MAG: AMP-binding protein [Gammaproteobacteria bacterium]|nr:AMP-binding protein [Gammaproteobacteria bacterium]
MTLSDLLTARAEQYGDREFLLFERQAFNSGSSTEPQPPFRQSLTFRELDQRVNQACHYLTSQGVGAGDVFNLHLPNCPAFLVLWFAAARLGAVMMPTNVLASSDELGYLLEHSGCRLAFTTSAHAHTLHRCKATSECLRKVILCDPCSENPGAGSFESELRQQADTGWDCQADDADMVAIMYTSGTTSKPKGVMVTHANYLIAGKTVADGEPGEITVKGVTGKSIMSGYFRNPVATGSCLRDGWLHTGDNAIRDEDGYYRFVDRKKDMIKRSGENVSAGEVENVLQQHPAVFECAVIGLPDELKDESIVGVVVLRPGHDVAPAELIAFCADKLAKFRVPGEIVIQQSLPKTSVGKIQKHLIREALLAHR